MYPVAPVDSTDTEHFHSLENSTKQHQSMGSESGTALYAVLPKLEMAQKLQEKYQQLLAMSPDVWGERSCLVSLH